MSISRLKKRLLVVYLLVGVLVILSACTGSAATQPPTRTPLVPTPLPTPLNVPAAPFEVTVDGLHIVGHCSGTQVPGIPVVILQSGNGGDETHLRGIERHLNGRTRVCAWARPGAGGSAAPASLPRPAEAVVAEMHGIITALKLEPPYFLVGQSYGGLMVFMFAQAYPDEVAGFVSMNPPPPYTKWVEAARPAAISEQMFADAEADYRGENPEQIDSRGNDSMLTSPLPSGMPYAVMYDEDCGGAPDCDVTWEAAVEELLASVGDGGRWIWAKGAGHEIHMTQPQLVADTIDEVWNLALPPR